MGQTLSEPVTTKETSSSSNKHYKVGSSCMQGWRINMEDSHTEILSLREDKGTAFFGVYDGHGGARVAQYCGRCIHTKIVNHSAWGKGNIHEAIKSGFLSCDTDMQKDEQMKDEMAGTTAVVVILKNQKIYCGNVGDSRAIASKKGAVEQLSYDHKPSNDDETRRIIAAGGWVEFNRVNGNLALSRALGDFCFKKNDKKSAEEQIVTALPDVIQKDVTSDHEFIVIACDGIWDVLSNQEVVDFVRTRISQRMEPEQICEELLTRCLAPDCQMGGLGCDNMTGRTKNSAKDAQDQVTVVRIMAIHNHFILDIECSCGTINIDGEFVQEKVISPSFWTSLMKCMLMILSTEKMSDKVTKEERERKFFDFFNCHFRPPHGFINESDSEHGFA